MYYIHGILETIKAKKRINIKRKKRKEFIKQGMEKSKAFDLVRLMDKSGFFNEYI